VGLTVKGVTEKGLSPVCLDSSKLLEGFWHDRARIVRSKIISYQWEAMNDRIPGIEKSHAVQNFRIAAGEAEGEFYGRPFQDSDVYKWLEAVAYSLNGQRDSDLESLADSVIDLLAKAQLPDGYLNTHFIISQMDKRWTNVRDHHELYCAGHLIEAAVAYNQATGKEKLLQIAIRLADHIHSTFGPEQDKIHGYPGHSEIELALVKLYRCTGERRYLSLCQFFIDERGKKPNFYEEEARTRGDDLPYGPWMGLYTNKYNQSHVPVREQKEAVGHAVRAMYLFSAMADLSKETGDLSLLDSCKTLWANVTNKQMYVTGSIGSSRFGEAFTFDYDLPNETAYNETCASIGLVMWAHRMLHIDLKGDYADVMETALYNGVLSGMSLDGTKYFYVNSLDVWPQSCLNRHDKQHVKPVRQEWFGCACCPPNLSRLFASLSQYMYSQSETHVYAHLYANSEVDIEIAGTHIKIRQKTSYPWDENVDIDVIPAVAAVFTVGLRIPGWCKSHTVTINGIAAGDLSIQDGYVRIERIWQPGDQIQLHFEMPVERIRSNPQLRVNSGKVVLRRGPVVYCLEEADNGPILSDISLSVDCSPQVLFEPDLLGGVTVIIVEGWRSQLTPLESSLYTDRPIERQRAQVVAVPYYAWNNRNPGEMLVWIRES
jgi:DUF1680 family protein